MNTSAATSGIMDAPDRLQDAVRDSHYLLAYFSRPRVDIPADKRDAFNDAVKTLSSFQRDRSRTQAEDTNTPNYSADEIAKFWNAFIFLSDLAYPATIESIRYYFGFYYNSGKRAEVADRRHGHRFMFRKTQSSFGFLTVIALFMTVGLGLLSYIGTQALARYDADYTHWSRIQTLVRYLDEGGKASFTGDQTAEGRRLVIKLPAVNSLVQINSDKLIAESRSLTDNSTAIDPKSEIFLDFPVAQIPRVNELLVDADLADSPPTSFEFSCPRILELFAKARGAKATDPVPPGALTPDECRDLMTKVKPHVLSVADDLAFTYSSMTAEREALSQVLSFVLFPVTIVDAVLTPFTWAYHELGQVGGKQMPAAQAAESNHAAPPSFASQNSPPQDIVLTAGQAYDLFVLLQQRHAPIPTIFPNPSVIILGTVFNARLAVSIINAYLLTLVFGLLGALVYGYFVKLIRD